jgi:hypothetical protein
MAEVGQREVPPASGDENRMAEVRQREVPPASGDENRMAEVHPLEVPASSAPAPPLPAPKSSHSELQERIREQLMRMYQSGSSRAEVERFITRFDQSEDYLHMVDEIYKGPGEGIASTHRGGMLGRLRRER